MNDWQRTAESLGLDPRFLITARLGRGTASLVYAVRDRMHNARRALKIASRSGQQRSFRSEYRRLAEVRHPNIIRSYDFGIAGNGMPYYTLELVRGLHLGALPERGDPEVLGLLARQVLDALASLHARGWVHRDVKPKNLLVAGKGIAALVRLIDLGLVFPAGDQSTATGTLPYMAPEVARGDVVDGRADLYSLGVVLYECLVGESPLLSLEDAVQRLRTLPPPPTHVNPLIPSGLSAFIMKLLAPDPIDRFADAGKAATALAQVSGLQLARGPARATAERLLRGGAVSHRRGLARRLRQVARAVVAGRRGCAVVVTGPIGVGKTPFLREAGLHLNLLGMRVMQLRTNNEPASPLPALRKAASELGDKRQVQQLESLAKKKSKDLSAFAGRMGAILARVFGDRPTALILDDLHRAEPIALSTLRSLGRELASVPVLLVCSADPRSDGVTLTEALGKEALELSLLPLRPSEVARLAKHRLHGLKLPRPALERLGRDSHGMPSLVERTLARMVVDGTIRRHGYGYVFVGGRYRAASHGDADLVRARIAHVRPEHQTVLWASAVLERGLEAELAGAVAEVPEGEAAQILAELARLEILAPGEADETPVYKFASRALVTAVYQAIPVDTRRRLHDRTAEVLKGSQRAYGRQEERVEHLLKGSDDDLAVDAAVEAGDRAGAVYADRRAIEYYARAFARLPRALDPRGGGIALRLGRVFERTGELARAAVWYQAAIRSGGIGALGIEIEATVGLGGVALVRGLLTEAEQHARQALELADKTGVEPRLRAAAQRLQALVLVRRGDFQAAERLLQKAQRALEKVQAEAQAVEVLLDLARLARARGELLSAVRYARRALHRARALGDASSVAEASTMLGRGFLKASRFRAARRALVKGLRVARLSGDRLREAAVLRELGNLRLRQGDFGGALERYERALDLVRVLRARSDESASLHHIGVVHARLGRFQASLRALEAAFDVGNAVGDVQSAAQSAVELGHVRTLLGDLDRAKEILETALQMAQGCGDQVACAEGAALRAWVHVCLGDSRPASKLLKSLDQRLNSLEDPASRARTLVYAVRCALAVSPGHEALHVAQLLRDEVEQGSLGDVRALARGLLGQAAEGVAKPDRVMRLVAQAADEACEQGLRPLEVELRAWLGARGFGGEGGVEQLTRGMEILRSVVLELPTNLVAIHLGRTEAVELREAFRWQRDRILDRVVGG